MQPEVTPPAPHEPEAESYWPELINFKLLAASVILCQVLACKMTTPPPADPVAAMREQTVHVLGFAGERTEGSGSGVVMRDVLGSNYVFTAAHCVPDTCDQRMVVEVHPLYGKVLVQLDAEIVWVDRQRDFALLRVTSPYRFARYATAATQRPAVGQRVQHVGFMGGHAIPHAYLSGLVSCHDTRAAGWVQVGCDTAALPVMGGCSGGPVFDDRDRLAGIVLGVTPSGIAFYLPLHQVAASIRDSKLGLVF